MGEMKLYKVRVQISYDDIREVEAESEDDALDFAIDEAYNELFCTDSTTVESTILSYEEETE